MIPLCIADAQEIAGFEVCVVDCTDDPAADAEMLTDRMCSKKGGHAPGEVIHSTVTNLASKTTL